MVSSLPLPNEIILDILELAANASQAAALNLYLLSSNIARSIRPILCRKLRLVLLHDTQVPSPVVLRPDPAAHRALQLHAHALGPVHQPEHRVLRGLATKCEALEELACAADWLLDRL